jgi:hypothetical protein
LELGREDGFVAGRGVFITAGSECNFSNGRSLVSAFVGTGRKEFVFSYFDTGYNSD